MAALTEISIDLKKIKKEKLAKGQYLNLIVSTQDELAQFGYNAKDFYSQTKEERDNKVNKVYLGNVQVVWTNGENVATAPRDGEQIKQPQPIKTIDEDLPF